MAPNRVFRACVGQRNPVSWFEGVGGRGGEHSHQQRRQPPMPGYLPWMLELAALVRTGATFPAPIGVLTQETPPTRPLNERARTGCPGHLWGWRLPSLHPNSKAGLYRLDFGRAISG
jgi:hypothetical protein